MMRKIIVIYDNSNVTLKPTEMQSTHKNKSYIEDISQCLDIKDLQRTIMLLRSL
jgi:hypothetical protein